MNACTFIQFLLCELHYRSLVVELAYSYVQLWMLNERPRTRIRQSSQVSEVRANVRIHFTAQPMT